MTGSEVRPVSWKGVGSAQVGAAGCSVGLDLEFCSHFSLGVSLSSFAEVEITYHVGWLFKHSMHQLLAYSQNCLVTVTWVWDYFFIFPKEKPGPFSSHHPFLS